MRSATTGTVSGCIVWIIAAFFIGSCVLPLAFFVSTWTSQSDFAVKSAARFICPAGTTPQVYTYDTTIPEEYDDPVAAVGHDLQCVDANHNVVKSDSFTYRFVWDGLGLVFALFVTAVLAFALATPAGVLIGRLFRPRQPAAAA